jgi:hypothetical protein
MKIQDSIVKLKSQHQSISIEHKSSQLSIEFTKADTFDRRDQSTPIQRTLDERNDLRFMGRSSSALAQRAERIRERMKQMYAIEDHMNIDLKTNEINDEDISITGDDVEDTKLIIFALMISRLIGKPVYISRIGAQISEAMSKLKYQKFPHKFDNSGFNKQKLKNLDFNNETKIQYEEDRSSFESESLSVQGEGVVLTDDGRELTFDASLNFDRFIQSKSSLSVTNEHLKDPLVLNFGSRPAQFTNQTMRFDLDADGSLDDLPILDSHGGILVIDHKEDGEITDGREVLGAVSGDGFDDLRALDQDDNQWLDKGDTAFQKLRVWTWDKEGNAHLSGLLEMGVHAIYLGAINASFTHKDQAQNTVAQNTVAQNTVAQQQAISVYLSESGEISSIRQLDLKA